MGTTLCCQYRLQSRFLTLSAGGVPRDYFNEKNVQWLKKVLKNTDLQYKEDYFPTAQMKAYIFFNYH